MNIRRALLIALGVASVAPRAVFAQPKRPPVVIGWLYWGSRESSIQRLAAFKEGLAALGYTEGQQVGIEERWVAGRRERLQPLAEELAAKKPSVIVASFAPAVRAAAKAAPKTPIVLVGGGDPVRLGFARSLARPGGMITGISNVVDVVREKYVELLVDAVPALKRIGVMLDRPVSGPVALERLTEAVRRSAAQHSLEVQIEAVTSQEEIEPAVSRLAKWGAQGLVVFYGALVTAEAARIAGLALAHRLPLVGPDLADVESGALLSYGADGSAMLRRAAYYVDRILKGTKPGDIPIEQPMTFELVVNLKNAKALGLTLPPQIMVQATRVIQ